MIKIASDAWMFFFPLIIMAGGFIWAGYNATGSLFFGLALFILFFFRDPDREIPAIPNGVVSPADGTVIRIDRDWLDDTTGEKRTRVSIFLSIFSVHINRFPVSGKIVKKEFHHGEFRAAFNHYASEVNSRSVLVIDTEYGIVTVKQIVGLIARRIVCNANEGDEAVKGARFGLMRFGSRMDVIMPSSAELKVELKDKVKGGSSIIALLK